MKKTSSIRRKKLPLLLGALLIISVAAYGTRAYFSDSAEQQANIALELGDVDIIMDDTSQWSYTPLSGVADSDYAVNTNLLDATGTSISADELAVIGDASKITNVRPGDAFTRKFVVTNDGTLDVKLGLVKGSIQKNVENTPFTIKIVEPENTLITPVETATYTVVITVDPEIGDEYNAGNFEYDASLLKQLSLNYIEENLTVEAIQANGEFEQN